jgi:hypothetical protein
MVRINLNRCDVGAYIRWYYNGWHHYRFTPYETEQTSEVYGTQVKERFSIISKVEVSTGKKARTYLVIGVESAKDYLFEGLKGILYSEVVELYVDGSWYELQVQRETYPVRRGLQPAYDLTIKAELIGLDITSVFDL